MYAPGDLNSIRLQRDITPAHAAAFIGISTSGYWDLESHSDEIDVFTVAEVVRLYVLMRVSSTDIRTASERPADPPAARSPEWFANTFGNIDISAHLRAAFERKRPTEDETGWEATAVEQWLTSDQQLYEMPIAALRDLCEPLEINLDDVLSALLFAVGM